MPMPRRARARPEIAGCAWCGSMLDSVLDNHRFGGRGGAIFDADDVEAVGLVAEVNDRLDAAGVEVLGGVQYELAYSVAHLYGTYTAIVAVPHQGHLIS